MSNAHATIKHARMEQGLGFGCNPPLRVDVTLVFNFHPFYSRHFLAMDMSSLLRISALTGPSTSKSRTGGPCIRLSMLPRQCSTIPVYSVGPRPLRRWQHTSRKLATEQRTLTLSTVHTFGCRQRTAIFGSDLRIVRALLYRSINIARQTRHRRRKQTTR